MEGGLVLLFGSSIPPVREDFKSLVGHRVEHKQAWLTRQKVS